MPERQSNPLWQLSSPKRTARPIPDEIRALLAAPDAVEAVTDGLRSLGIAGYVDFPAGTEATPDFGVRFGPVLTLRYIPKQVPNNDNRIGHDIIAKAIEGGEILVADEQDCVGSVIGGNSAGKLRRAGAEALVVNGFGRDFDEVHSAGLPALATRWGLGSAKLLTELSSISEPINFRGVAVHATDVAVVNRWGMALIPAELAWDDLVQAANLK